MGRAGTRCVLTGVASLVTGLCLSSGFPAAAVAQSALGEPAGADRAVVDFRVERYRIDGTTFLEAYEEIERAGPVDARGSRRHGLTTYEIQPSWVLVPRGSRCRVDRVRVDARVTVQLPLWTGLAEATDQSREVWNEYIRELRAHEYGHRDLAVEAAHDLARELSLIEGDTCETARGRAYQTMQRIDRAMRMRQSALDGA
jgi:predicted secreted Zn-dependent protease